MKFREDLYYRLNVVSIELPPLRARKEDIPLLAENILRRLCHKYHWPHLGLAPEVVNELLRLNWPGNIRELQNVLARAAIQSRGKMIQKTDLDAAIPRAADSPPFATGSLVLRDALAEVEKRVIRQALEQENWNRTLAARVLGISRRQLFDKIQQYGLQQ